MCSSPTPKNPDPIRVMLVDDSAVVRGFITRILESDPDISVIYSAQNGEVAVGALDRQDPDVVLLDVEMPVMDGLTTIPHIIAKKPNVRIIMCSTLTTENAATTLKAMSLGAIDCIGKPTSSHAINTQDVFKDTLLNKVKEIGSAARSRKGRSPSARSPMPPPVTVSSPSATAQNISNSAFAASSLSKETVLRPPHEGFSGKPDILAIGSSTGGPNALFNVLKHCTGFNIPIVLTQHMPATFTKILAEHIIMQTGVPAVEAEDRMPLLPGRVHVAQGGLHMLIEKVGNDKIIRLNDGPMENFCKPAVDPMLRSLLPIYGERILTVILTGMGSDGLAGSRDVAAKGGRILAQDEATSVVWGMPGAVARAGICSAVLPLDEIGPAIRKAVCR